MGGGGGVQGEGKGFVGALRALEDHIRTLFTLFRDPLCRRATRWLGVRPAVVHRPPARATRWWPQRALVAAACAGGRSVRWWPQRALVAEAVADGGCGRGGA